MTRGVLHSALDRGAYFMRERLNWLCVPVCRVVPAGDAVPMCVTVPDGGRFLQNGFDGSNSQGSEAKSVVVWASDALVKPGNGVDALRWLYTAITRAVEEAHVIMESKLMWLVKSPPKEVAATAAREAEQAVIYGRNER